MIGQSIDSMACVWPNSNNYYIEIRPVFTHKAQGTSEIKAKILLKQTDK